MTEKIDETVSDIEKELFNQRNYLKRTALQIEELRVERAKIYEQNAAEDADISKKFDDYKTPTPVGQKHYDLSKSVIKVVYYAIRESKKGLGMDDLKDLLATRIDTDIRDAVWFLSDGGNVKGPSMNGKWSV